MEVEASASTDSGRRDLLPPALFRSCPGTCRRSPSQAGFPLARMSVRTYHGVDGTSRQAACLAAWRNPYAAYVVRSAARGAVPAETAAAQAHIMKHAKRTRLERKGWRVGSAEDFLDLNPAEAAIIETKLALSRSLRDRRAAEGLSQAALAKRLCSSQSRVAKMEAGDSSVSIDLLLRALYSLGARPRDVASILARRRGAAA